MYGRWSYQTGSCRQSDLYRLRQESPGRGTAHLIMQVRISMTKVWERHHHHFWLFQPLQSQTWTLVPLCVAELTSASRIASHAGYR